MKVRTCNLLLLVTLALPVWSADDLMTSYLVDQAHEWEQKDRPDMALDLWRKILQVSPNHQEALLKLGLTKGQKNSTGKVSLPAQLPAPAKPKPLNSARLTTKTKQPIKVEPPPAPRKVRPVESSAASPKQFSEETISQPLAPHLEPTLPALNAPQPLDGAAGTPVVIPKQEKLKLKLSNSIDMDSTQRKH